MVLGMLNNLLMRRGISGPASVEGGLGIPEGYLGSAGRKELVRSDFYTSNVTMSANNDTNFEELGAFTVGAQQAVRPGFGAAALPDNQGQFYFSGQNPASTVHEGFVRLNWKSANKDRIDLIKELRTENLRGSTTTRDQQVLLPEQPIRGLQGRNFAAEDEFISLDFKGDSASLVFSTTTTTILVSSHQYFR